MKVPLLKESHGDFFAKSTKPISASLPFYQREGGGYVHRARSGYLHYDNQGRNTHTSISFWCGATGFLYPKGKQDPKKSPASMVESPNPGRVVCATCQARAHGSGQVGTGKLGDEFVKFHPRPPFFGRKGGR